MSRAEFLAKWHTLLWETERDGVTPRHVADGLALLRAADLGRAEWIGHKADLRARAHDRATMPGAEDAPLAAAVERLDAEQYP